MSVKTKLLLFKLKVSSLKSNMTGYTVRMKNYQKMIENNPFLFILRKGMGKLYYFFFLLNTHNSKFIIIVIIATKEDPERIIFSFFEITAGLSADRLEIFKLKTIYSWYNFYFPISVYYNVTMLF